MTCPGSCHCGGIAYEVEGGIAQVLERNGSHCARKRFVLWCAPRAALQLKTAGSALSQYTCNRHAIRHRFCAVCGCARFAFGKDPQGDDTVAVTVRGLPELDLGKLRVAHFDGRSIWRLHVG